jgi:hypothetical protein
MERIPLAAVSRADQYHIILPSRRMSQLPPLGNLIGVFGKQLSDDLSEKGSRFGRCVLDLLCICALSGGSGSRGALAPLRFISDSDYLTTPYRREFSYL